MVGANMKKTALKKDFKMEIKKTMNRFLSILFIVALGVAFFSGIQSAAPDMRYTADEYFDQHGLADIKVISTLEIPGVEQVYAGYMADVLCGEENSQKVLHVESIFDDINKLDVEEGRLPEKVGECFLDTDFAAENNYHVGDTIVFSEEKGEDEETLLKTTQYTVSGIGSASAYISFGRGSSTLGTGTVAGFAYILPENFDSEIYTQAYITVEGAKELTAYTEEYDNRVEAVKDALDEQTKIMGEERYDSIMSEAKGSLANANRTLARTGRCKTSDAGRREGSLGCAAGHCLWKRAAFERTGTDYKGTETIKRQSGTAPFRRRTVRSRMGRIQSDESPDR